MEKCLNNFRQYDNIIQAKRGRGEKMKKIERAIQLLEEHGQETVIKEIKKHKNPELIEQVLTLDFQKIEQCKEKIGKQEQEKQERIEKIPYIDGNKLKQEEIEKYETIGKEIIAKGKYAVVTMAGGQRNKTWS